ncbi:MAG: hypothetical protein AAB380_08875 [Verrucomicrobiota bacterium]
MAIKAKDLATRGEVFPLAFNNKRKAFANAREAFSFEVGLAMASIIGEVLPGVACPRNPRQGRNRGAV